MEHSSNKGIILILSILFIVVMMIPITGLIIAPSEINWIEQPRYELGGHSLYDLFESDERVRATRKNLFGINNPFSLSTVDSYFVDGTSLTIIETGAAGGGLKQTIKVKINTTYALSGTITNTLGTNGRIRITNSAGTYLTQFTGSIVLFSVRLVLGETDTITLDFQNGVDNVYTVVYTNIQLEQGTDATTYEPYKDNEMVLAETLAYTGWDWIHFTGLEYFGLEYMDYDDLNDFYRLYISYKYH